MIPSRIPRASRDGSVNTPASLQRIQQGIMIAIGVF